MKSLSSLREAIIRAHERGKTVMEIVDFLGISHSTVSKAIKRFEETGSNEDRPGKGRKKSARSNRRAAFWQRVVVLSTRHSPRTQGKRNPRLLARPMSGLHHQRRVATELTGFEPVGLSSVEHFGGESMC